jgi:hypothetical protein
MSRNDVFALLIGEQNNRTDLSAWDSDRLRLTDVAGIHVIATDRPRPRVKFA